MERQTRGEREGEREKGGLEIAKERETEGERGVRERGERQGKRDRGERQGERDRGERQGSETGGERGGYRWRETGRERRGERRM